MERSLALDTAVIHDSSWLTGQDSYSSQIKSNRVVDIVQEIHIDQIIRCVEGVVAVVPCVRGCVPKFSYCRCDPSQTHYIGSQGFEVEVLDVCPFVRDYSEDFLKLSQSGLRTVDA